MYSQNKIISKIDDIFELLDTTKITTSSNINSTSDNKNDRWSNDSNLRIDDESNNDRSPKTPKTPNQCIICQSDNIIDDYSEIGWECSHKYCSNCITRIINEQMSLFNNIPKCSYPECNQLLNIKSVYNVCHKKFIKKYQIKITFKEYDSINKLISGYIRRINNIPNDILLLIFDYYILDIFKIIECDAGYHNWSQCSYSCHYCLDTQYVLTVDIAKLCRKQALCMKCNQYFPMSSITYWSQCNHILCMKCFLNAVKNDVLDNKIPTCPDLNCQQEIGQNDVTFLNDLWGKTSKKFTIKSTINSIKEYRLRLQLNVLLFRKNRFECVYCGEWHKNIDLFIDKKINCNHKYSNQCHKHWENKCGHSQCIKCQFKCEICRDFHENKYLVKWSKCGHKYDKLCAKKYVNQWISEESSVWNNILPNTDYLIPLCIHKECNKLLDVLCAQRIGITKYQYETLYYLREQSILTKDNNND